MVVAGAGF